MVTKNKVQLKDIPLTTRANRILLRESIKENSEKLEEMFKEQTVGTDLSFDDWLIMSQGVNIKALNDLEAIDKLPDEEYVEAIVAFKKAELQIYHKKELDEGRTDKHLFDWTLEHFGVHFNDIGREEAIMDIEGIEPHVVLELTDDPKVFVVNFDNTIAEIQGNKIGPASPYSIETLSLLKKKGHIVLILTYRTDNKLTDMFNFFDGCDFKPSGVVRSIHSTGFYTKSEVDIIDDSFDFNNNLYIDFIIHDKNFGSSLIQITGLAHTNPTLYWGDIVDILKNHDFLSEDDVKSLIENM